MALERKTILDQIEVKKEGTIFLKELNQIVEGDVVVSSSPHRTAFEPWQDQATLPEVIKPYAAIAWTPEVVAAAKAKLQGQ